MKFSGFQKFQAFIREKGKKLNGQQGTKLAAVAELLSLRALYLFINYNSSQLKSLFLLNI